MNPTKMRLTLYELGRKFVFIGGLKTQELCNGINRVQWEGPWLEPGVPARVAYRHTHWVAHLDGWVLCTVCNPAEWIPVEDWREYTEQDFHITHHYAIP